MANNLSWVPAYEAALAGTYGDSSKDVIARLLSEDPSRAAMAQNFTVGNTVDWSKLPQFGPGTNLPANSMLAPSNSLYRTDQFGNPIKPTGPVYNDPNYGSLELIQKRAPDDNIMKIGRALTLALVGGGIGSALAPAIGGAFGFGSGANSTIASLLRMLPGLIQSGGGNWGSIAGSLAGGATGIPFGSTVGGMVGGQFNRPEVSMAMTIDPALVAMASQLSGGWNKVDPSLYYSNHDEWMRQVNEGQPLSQAYGGGGGTADWGTALARLIGGGASLYDAFGHGGTTDMGVAKTAAGMADPFASQRPQYQQQLAALLANPNSIRDEPGYQFGLDQGLDTIKGGANAIYQSNRAGAVLPELMKFGTGYADQAYNTRLGQLMQLAGVNAGSPGTAGLLYERGGENQNRSTGGGIADILGGLLGGPGGGAAGGLLGLLGKILNPSGGGGGGSGPGDPSGMPWGMGNRSDGGIGDGWGMNDRGIGQGGSLPYQPDPTWYGDPGGDNQFDFGQGGFGDDWFNEIFGN